MGYRFQRLTLIAARTAVISLLWAVEDRLGSGRAARLTLRVAMPLPRRFAACERLLNPHFVSVVPCTVHMLEFV